MSPKRIQSVLTLLALTLGIVVVMSHAFLKPAPESRDVQNLMSYRHESTRWQGKYPPDFSLRLRNGEEFRLSDQIGRKVIILNFFATWCGPCKAEMPEFQAYYARHKDTPFVLLGIDADEKSEAVDGFRDEMHLSFPVGIDTNGAIAKRYGVRSYPTTVFIGADGRIALFQIGTIPNADVAFEPLVQINAELIRKKLGITRAAYEAGLSNQDSPLATASVERRSEEKKIKLQGSARAFADRMKCPECGEFVNECGCGLCDAVKKRLSTMDFTNKTDDQVLEALFMNEEKP